MDDSPRIIHSEFEDRRDLDRSAAAARVAQRTTQNLAPEAAQVQQLTTFEVLNAVNANAPENDSSDSDFRRERLSLGEIYTCGSHWRTKINDFGCFVYRNVPHGVKANRLGIQWVCIALVTTTLIFIRPPDHWFWGPVWTPLATFVSINALTTIDLATGATNRNAVLRILGTTLGAVFSFAVLIPMIIVGWGGAEDSYMVRWVMYYACVPAPFIWGFFIHHYPTYMHENFTFQGLSTQVYLFGSYSTRIVFDMCICTLGCYVGAIIGFVGYQVLVPLRARDKLTHEISLIAYKLSYSLEPLIELESGVKARARRKQRGSLYTRSVSKLREWRAHGRRGEIGRRGTMIARSMSKRFGAAEATAIESPNDLDQFRDHVWETLNDCLKLMEQHDEVMAHAKREHYWTDPHFFRYNDFKRIRDDCMALYYHITSLFLLLQTQLTSTPSEAAYNDLRKLLPAMEETEAPENLIPGDFGGLFDQSQLSRTAEELLLRAGDKTLDDMPSVSPTSPRSAELDRSSTMPISLVHFASAGDQAETNLTLNSRLVSPPQIRNSPGTASVSESPRSPGQLQVPPVKSLYTPLEALSSAKLPRREADEEPDAVGTLRQETEPTLPDQQSTMSMAPARRASTDLSISRLRSALSWLPKRLVSQARRAPVEEASPRDLATLSPLTLTIHSETSASHRTSQADLLMHRESELRSAVMSAAREEKNELIDVLQSVQDQLVTGGPNLLVPESSLGAPAGTEGNVLMPPELPNFGSPRASVETRTIRVGGELEILVSAPPETAFEEAPVASAKVIGLAPVVKWAALFGPLIGEVAENMARVLELVGEALDQVRWNEHIWPTMIELERSLAKLAHRKRDWWHSSEEIASLINSNMCQHDDEAASRAKYDELEEKFCLPWLGLTLEAYGRLPSEIKDDLWVSFESMQDRQVVAIKTCIALMKRLRSFAQNSEAFLTLQFPRHQTEALRRKYEVAREQTIAPEERLD